MTATLSAILRTTPRSCVISSSAMPNRAFRSVSRSRICAWMVTSSAVVGSSAIRMSGSFASAIAIITRCRCPPDSSCGYDRSRAAGSGMPTSSSNSTIRARAFAPRNPLCSASDSPICLSTVCSGFNDVIGSWKTMAILAPRICRNRDSGAPRSSCPSKRMLPEV